MVRYDKIVELRFILGTNIEDAISTAIEYASQENCIVKFMLNGVLMDVYHFSSVKDKVDYYQTRLNHKNELEKGE